MDDHRNPLADLSSSRYALAMWLLYVTSLTLLVPAEQFVTLGKENCLHRSVWVEENVQNITRDGLDERMKVIESVKGHEENRRSGLG